MKKVRIAQNYCCCATAHLGLENLLVFFAKEIVASRIFDY